MTTILKAARKEWIGGISPAEFAKTLTIVRPNFVGTALLQQTILGNELRKKRFRSLMGSSNPRLGGLSPCRLMLAGGNAGSTHVSAHV